ncbi:MAG: RNA recognition motif domain-containing protein, partial [Bdellovibrionota bacterium]
MNKKLYVGNLPFSAEEAQLKALFGADGRQVASVRILLDKMTGRSRGFGFVEMASPDDAQKAMDALHGHEFLGRALTVTEAREQEPRGGGGRAGFGGGFGGGGGGGGFGGEGGGGGGGERGGR